MVRFSFAGRPFAALTGGALWWPERRALLVADLHLEKASWFAARGQMLPPYDSAATLADLAGLVAATNPREIWCLGDSFHDPDGSARLPSEAANLLQQLTSAAQWVWVTGNHDIGGAVDRYGGTIAEEAEVDGLMLRHEARSDEVRPELSGHFHPKLRVNLRGRSVARRCFVASSTKLILPAFGSLTGGLDAAHPEIVRAVGFDACALVPVSDQMLSFPIAA